MNMFSLQIQTLPGAVARAQAEIEAERERAATQAKRVEANRAQRRAAPAETTRQTHEKLRAAILKHLADGPASRNELAIVAGRTPHGVIRLLRDLRDDGKIRSQGWRSGSLWEAVK